MPCGRRQSYNVNPSNKKDNSFKLFITFLLAVLLVYLVIYALIVILTKQRNYGKENEKPIIKSSATIFSLLYQKDNLNISEESTEASNDKEQLYTTTTGNNEDSTEEPIELESATTENEISTLSTNKQTSTAEENPILIAIESTYLAATKLLTSTTDKAITEEICQRPDCKKMAIDLLKNINFSIDPCEDFYQFSCGNEAKSSNSEDFDVLFEEIENPKDDGVRSFGRFFNSCLDYTKQFDTIKQILSINVRSSNMTTLLGFLLLRQSTPLFEIVEGSNGEIQILPPNSYDTDILENWSLKTHIDKHCLTSRNLDDYKQCQSKTLNKMLKNLHSFKNNEKPMGDDFVLNIIKQQIPTINIQEALFKKSCQQVDIPQLNKNYPIIDWQILLSTISETQNSICIYFKSDYFDPIMSDLKSKNESEVLNSIKDYFQLQLYQNLIFQRNSEFCMNQAVALMPEIAEKIFQKYVFNNERFEKMFEEVKAKFNWLIEVSKLKEDDKSLLQNKLKLLKIEYNTKKFAPEDYHDANDDYLTKLFMLLEVKRMIHKEKKTILFKKIDLVNDTIIASFTKQLPGQIFI
ncbi:unnamed protein product [Ceutorhynchus assimilis]|uniref:Peptidase M13 N-terminal domain-containing protein n=1 Tax=Ceutorhynchus assimilis TaxID=467358 RepID=A0A9P0DJ74_9CUCU|nr:unnamed protein product [Ceutorhynchus assimilis]